METHTYKSGRFMILAINRLNAGSAILALSRRSGGTGCLTNIFSKAMFFKTEVEAEWWLEGMVSKRNAVNYRVVKADPAPRASHVPKSKRPAPVFDQRTLFQESV